MMMMMGCIYDLILCFLPLCEGRPVFAREAAIVTRLLQQLVEMYAHGIDVDMEALVLLVGVIRRMEAARVDPVLMQCCEALGK